MIRRIGAAWRVLLGRPIVIDLGGLDGKEIARAVAQRLGRGDATK